ncbi:hypothetical protein [Lysobacter silvisoli]|uniref:DUF1449 family protein n=1 Tax=Lysobacter silvisoli TaxID=2293254 RepID=A0A371JYK9_9GAMM|nr:hypothetical protein [Lysobacter silvisoli]RDZ26759.1 hypothetical protein DX914_17470 [Lysobacter silvisoli]
MFLFLQTVLSFPTVVFSVLLAAAVLYWLVAALGLLEIDVLDGWFGGDSADVDAEAMAGPLMRYGLGGVPLTLVLTVLVFFAWLLCYFAELLVLRHLPGALHWALGLGVAAGALVVSAFATGVALRPARRFFAKLKPAPQKSVLGQTAIVRSPEITPSLGMASVEDGGAGLILQVRDEGGRYKRGDRVVLIEYLPEQNAYRVVGEDEFQGL